MDYDNFLFSQLFMRHVENNETLYGDDLEYDLIYPEVLKHRDIFMKSEWNNENLSMYAGILNYLVYEVK